MVTRTLRCVLRQAVVIALFTIGQVVAMHETAAAETPPSSDKSLVVAVVDIPPFAIAQTDGSWSGLGVDLWREVAETLQLRWEAREVRQDEVDALLRDHVVDVAIGAVVVSAEGERNHDYSAAYLTAGLGFAERTRRTMSWSAATAVFGNSEFLELVLVIGIAIAVVGAIVAIVERTRNTERFGGPLSHGMGTGMWWAAAVMTTLGDDASTPRTRFGRVIAFVWMFVGVTTLAYFTATISALLTVGALQETVRDTADLYRLRLGAVPGSPGAEFLGDRHVAFAPFASHKEMLAGLADGKIEAGLAPLPVLRYETSKDWQGVLHASSLVLEPVSYAFGLPEGSPLREPLNRELLRITEEDRWKDVESRYFGRR